MIADFIRDKLYERRHLDDRGRAAERGFVAPLASTRLSP
jgi:hypothetical protein